MNGDGPVIIRRPHVRVNVGIAGHQITVDIVECERCEEFVVRIIERHAKARVARKRPGTGIRIRDPKLWRIATPTGRAGMIKNVLLGLTRSFGIRVINPFLQKLLFVYDPERLQLRLIERRRHIGAVVHEHSHATR